MIAGGNMNYFALFFREKYGIPGDPDGRNSVRWLDMCNPRAQYVNRAGCQGYSSLFGQGDFVSGN
jgi:hypothetical protein